MAGTLRQPASGSSSRRCFTATTTRKYLHRDHLGSVVAVSGEAQSGNAPILAEYSFDAWGAHRNPADWTAATSNLSTSASGDRGFTGHEMLDEINLIHMNGRIYSQELGRFLSADPLIQAPENLQSFNRYSYVFNNPLTHTDPSGFESKKKKSSSEAATASTQLSEKVSSTEISSQDNVGGSTSESSEQVDDYYSDSSGNTQVDSTNRAKQTDSSPGDESIGSTANPGDKNGYGTGTGSEEASDQAAEGENKKFANGTQPPEEASEQGGNSDCVLQAYRLMVYAHTGVKLSEKKARKQLKSIWKQAGGKGDEFDKRIQPGGKGISPDVMYHTLKKSHNLNVVRAEGMSLDDAIATANSNGAVAAGMVEPGTRHAILIVGGSDKVVQYKDPFKKGVQTVSKSQFGQWSEKAAAKGGIYDRSSPVYYVEK